MGAGGASGCRPARLRGCGGDALGGIWAEHEGCPDCRKWGKREAGSRSWEGGRPRGLVEAELEAG